MRLRNLIPSADCGTQNTAGMWVRAMHEPFYDGLFEKLRTAWQYIKRDDLVVVQWPVAGEFEQAAVRAETGP